MLSRLLPTFLCFLLLSNAAWAAKQFRLALPGYQYKFPADHASHDEFKTEWWYYTGHLKATDGQKFGFELTFFRSGIDPEGQPRTNWRFENVYMAHFAISDLNGKKFTFYEKLNRPSLGVAGAKTGDYRVWNEQWSASIKDGSHQIQADAKDFGLALKFASVKPPIVHGKDGVSQKASCRGCASHYYSMTRLKADGTLTIQGKPYPVTGSAWMDHEFGSNQLTAEQVGWDWFSLQLDNNYELMLYVIRRKDGSIDSNSSATLIGPEGGSEHFKLAQFDLKNSSKVWASPTSGARYPMGWSIDLPSKNISLEVKPYFDGQELDTATSTGVVYWEGACSVSGSMADKPVNGDAYVEMTGYKEAFRKNI